MLAEAARPPVRELETTYKREYEDKPAAAVAADPDSYRTTASTFGKTKALQQTTYDASEQPKQAGRGGARGEITRRPAESGNPYGVHVRGAQGPG
jgi:hypothetical protein